MADNRIKEIRKEKGITQAQLAKLLGVTQGAIQFWENGEREPTLKTLKDIAKVLNCEAWELLPLDMQPNISQDDWALLRLIRHLAPHKNDSDSEETKAG